MRVLVCGSRSAWDATETWAAMDKLDPIPDLVICGGSIGVDKFAESWAERRGIACALFPAPWDSHLRNTAGPIRNGWMLKFGRPDLVLALPGGNGTLNMIEQAKRAGVPVRKAGKWSKA